MPSSWPQSGTAGAGEEREFSGLVSFTNKRACEFGARRGSGSSRSKKKKENRGMWLSFLFFHFLLSLFHALGATALSFSQVPPANILCAPTPANSRIKGASSSQKQKMPAESALPFVLITVMVAGMGSLQQGVHKLFNGKPKPVGVDAFDRAVAARDKKIREEASKVN